MRKRNGHGKKNPVAPAEQGKLLLEEDILIGKKVYLPTIYHGEKGTKNNPILKVKKILYSLSDNVKLVLLEDGTTWGYSYVKSYEEKIK